MEFGTRTPDLFTLPQIIASGPTLEGGSLLDTPVIGPSKPTKLVGKADGIDVKTKENTRPSSLVSVILDQSLRTSLTSSL